VTVADLQRHLRSLGQFLTSAGTKGAAAELEALSARLEPFRDYKLKAFGDFLAQAGAGSRGERAPKPSRQKEARGAAPRKAGPAADEVERLCERIRHQYHHATDPGVTREEIEATARELAPLSKAQLDDLARQIDITQKFRSRDDAIKAIRQKILDRKSAFERVYA
jgi:hypothetical protein